MADDGPERGEPDPLLAGSDGDEAKILAERESRKKWLGVAAGVGVGSAAIAAAMMFWGQKDRKPKPEAPRGRNTRPEANAQQPNGEPRE